MEYITNLEQIKIGLSKKGIFLDEFINKAVSGKKIIVLCGPTAAGKTEIAFNLANILATDIISIDSMQVYKGMDIGTDKKKPGFRNIKQFMTDLYSPEQCLTVVSFREICREIIKEKFFDKKKIPVLAGGSGLYLRSVVDGLEFVDLNFTSQKPKNNNVKYHPDSLKNKSVYNKSKEKSDDLHSIREAIKMDIEKKGVKEAFNKLEKIDPLYAKKISPNDLRRIIRALEVYEITGLPFSSFQDKWVERKSIYNCSFFGIIKDKKNLHDDIKKRVDLMLERGLVEEVELLVEKGYGNFPSLTQAVGYKEVLCYIKGEISLGECREMIIKNTRKLAKKQMTWFKADPRIKWIRVENYDNILTLVNDIIEISWIELKNEKN